MLSKDQYFKENPKHVPTAVPARRYCPVCGKIPDAWSWCKKHYRWEGSNHMVEAHGIIIGEKQ